MPEDKQLTNETNAEHTSETTKSSNNPAGTDDQLEKQEAEVLSAIESRAESIAEKSTSQNEDASFERKETGSPADPLKGPKVFYNASQAKAAHQLTAAEQQTLKQQWQKLEVPEDEAQAFLPDYFFAGFWIRSFAFILDLLCIAAIRTSTVGLIYRFLGIEWQGGFLGAYNLAAIGIYLIYFTLLTKLNHGQTIGKMVFGLRVIALNGTELTWGAVLTREAVCRFILMRPPFLLGYLPTAFTRRKQHVGDYFAETSVVTVNLVKAFNKELA